MIPQRRQRFHARVESLETRMLLAGQKIAYVVAGIGGLDYPVAVVNDLVQQGYTVHTPWWNSTDPVHDNPVPDLANPGKVTPYVRYTDSNPGSFQMTTQGLTPGGTLSVAMDLGAPNTPDAFVNAVVKDLETHDGQDTVVLIGHGLGGDSILQVAQRIAADEAAGKTTVKIDLLGLLDPMGFVDAASNPTLVQDLISGAAIADFIPGGATRKVSTLFSNGKGGKAIPVNDDGMIPALRGGLPSVPSSVDYVYNRWQTNLILPFDFSTVNTALPSAAFYSTAKDFGIADQAVDNVTTAHTCDSVERLYGLCPPNSEITRAIGDAHFPLDPTIQTNLITIINQIPLKPHSFVVTTTLDQVNGLPARGSLRAAILASNGTPGTDTITFKINSQLAVEVIKPLTPLPVITDPVTIDAATQPGYVDQPIVSLDGSLTTGDGLEFAVGNSLVKGLGIAGFTSGAGIRLDKSDNVGIQNSWIGVDPTGRNALGNGIGVLVEGGSGITIGGNSPSLGNLISGNLTAGIYLNGPAVSGNQISGNRIGSDRFGTASVLRTGSNALLNVAQNAGVAIVGSSNNTVVNNLISGNVVGVQVSGAANHNLIDKNLIGTDVTGMHPLSNVVGVYLQNAGANQVGSVGVGNVISANTSVGIELYGLGATGNQVVSNLIGLASDGKSTFSNTSGFVQQTGVYLESASNNMIGGTGNGAGNSISGNQEAGIYILSRASVAAGNLIQGNLIGQSSSGTTGPGNAGFGVLLYNSPNNAVTRTGTGANQFGGNVLDNIRTYQGPIAAQPNAAQAVARAKAKHIIATSHKVRVAPKHGRA